MFRTRLTFWNTFGGLKSSWSIRCEFADSVRFESAIQLRSRPAAAARRSSLIFEKVVDRAYCLPAHCNKSGRTPFGRIAKPRLGPSSESSSNCNALRLVVLGFDDDINPIESIYRPPPLMASKLIPFVVRCAHRSITRHSLQRVRPFSTTFSVRSESLAVVSVDQDVPAISAPAYCLA